MKGCRQRPSLNNVLIYLYLWSCLLVLCVLFTFLSFPLPWSGGKKKYIKACSNYPEQIVHFFISLVCPPGGAHLTAWFSPPPGLNHCFVSFFQSLFVSGALCVDCKPRLFKGISRLSSNGTVATPNVFFLRRNGSWVRFKSEWEAIWLRGWARTSSPSKDKAMMVYEASGDALQLALDWLTVVKRSF